MIKYKPVPTWIGETRFDSKFEAEIFKLLRAGTYRPIGDYYYQLRRQLPIVVKDSCNVFPIRKWRCDFRLDHESLGYLHIEAKGFITDLWLYQLELLEATNPGEFKRVRIVTLNDEVRSKLKKMDAQIYSPMILQRHVNRPTFWEYGNQY